MNASSPELLDLLTHAAELRAAGNSWEAVGRRVGRHPDTCRHWTTTYPDLWRQLFQAAREAPSMETDAEARLILRELLRSENEKTRLAAAQKLLQPRPRSGPAAAAADAETIAFLAELRGLTDDDLDHLIRRFAESPGPAAGGLCPPGPPVAQ